MASALAYCLPNPSVLPVAISGQSQMLALCLEAPASVSTQLGCPGQGGFCQPQGILDTWIFRLAGVQVPGQKAEQLCLPENRANTTVPSECHGWQRGPGLQPTRVGTGGPLAVCPPTPGPRSSLASGTGIVGGALRGFGEPSWASRRLAPQVCFQRSHTSGLSCLRFRERAPAQAENGPWFKL